MPPKPDKKEMAKKPPPQIARPPISESSLVYIPEDAIEGIFSPYKPETFYTSRSLSNL